jgi:hypothetical protein
MTKPPRTKHHKPDALEIQTLQLSKPLTTRATRARYPSHPFAFPNRLLLDSCRTLAGLLPPTPPSSRTDSVSPQFSIKPVNFSAEAPYASLPSKSSPLTSINADDHYAFYERAKYPPYTPPSKRGDQLGHQNTLVAR